jgi:hypothetical protein
MSNMGRYVDRNPYETGAGLVTTIADENTANCIKPPVIRQTTPPNVKKYRKTFNADPGVRQRHHGPAYDERPEGNFTYGKKTHDSDHVDHVIKAQQKTQFAEYSDNIREGAYASTKNEPLGQSLARDYKNLP